MQENRSINIKIFLTLIMGVYLATSISTWGETDFILVEKGEPKATIVLAEQPGHAAAWAAEELNHYIKKITGVQLPVVSEKEVVAGRKILIGASILSRKLGINENSFKEQEYIIHTTGDYLLLLGRDSPGIGESGYHSANGVWSGFDFLKSEIGTIYAVDDLLRKYCGVHWYLPTDLGEVVKKTTTLIIPSTHIRRSPSAVYRYPEGVFRQIPETLYWWDTKTDILDFPDLAADLKNKYWIRLKAGGRMFKSNHSFYKYAERFKETHPEYFAHGQDGQPSFSQLCYTNKKLINQVVKDIVAVSNGQMKDDAGKTRFSNANRSIIPLVPNDNRSACYCKSCESLKSPERRPDIFSNGTLSNLHFLFCNEVAKKVQLQAPHMRLSTLAYSRYYLPPDIPGFKLEKNIELLVCRANLTSSVTLFDGKHYRLGDLKKWSDIAQGGYYTWEYFLFPQYVVHNAFPSIVPRRISKEFKRMLADKNYKGSYIQLGERDTKGRFADPVMQFHNLYVAMRVLDDPTFDVNQELNSFYKSFFGPAAKQMKNVFSIMEQMNLQEGKYKNISSANKNLKPWSPLCTSKQLKELMEIVSIAKENVSEKSIYQKRLELFDKAIFNQMRVSAKRHQLKHSLKDHQVACVQIKENTLADNVLDSELWSHTIPVTTFFNFAENEVKHINTEVKVLMDNKNLYVRFMCMNPPGKAFKASKRNRDNISMFKEDDVTEVFIDTGDITGYYHFAANAAGSLYDAVRKDSSWDSEIKVITSSESNVLKIVYTLPISSKTLFLPKGKENIRINFTRSFGYLKHGNLDKFISWQPGGFHQPANFADLNIVQSVNLLPNSGFEFPRSWKTFGSVDSGWRVLDICYNSNKTCSTLDKNIKYQGSQSIKVTDNSTMVSSPITVDKMIVYNFSIMAKIQNAKAIPVNIYFDPWRGTTNGFTKPGGRVGGEVVLTENEVGEDGWKRYSIEVQGFPHSKVMGFICFSKLPPNAVVWIDNVSLSPVRKLLNNRK